MGDIDIAVVDSLKVLDPRRPIREADSAYRLGCLLSAIRDRQKACYSITSSAARRLGPALLQAPCAQACGPGPDPFHPVAALAVYLLYIKCRLRPGRGMS